MRKPFLCPLCLVIWLQLLLLPGASLSGQAGFVDTTFGVGSGASHIVNVIALQPDSKIVVAGEFTTFNTTPVHRIVRLHPDGTHDLSYQTYLPLGGFDGPVRSGTIQPDGKMLLGGLFNTVHAHASKNIVRLNTDGSRDTSFVVTSGASNEVLVITTNGQKIFVAGFFHLYNGVSAPGIALLNMDGTLDTVFQLPVQAFVSVRAAVMLPGNTLYVGGTISTYNGVQVNHLFRLNPDGTLDTTFNTGLGFNSGVTSLALQPDGKLIVGGNFTTFNGLPASRLTRLNPDGSHDPTFLPGTGPNYGPRSINLQPDGKIIIAGDFFTYHGFSVNRIARLLPDATFDTTFSTTGGTNGTVMTTVLQPDGKVLAGGNFTQAGGVQRHRIIRLTTDLCVHDTIPPVPLISTLPDINHTCEATITAIPQAVDNCSGLITATTNDPLHYATPGTFTVTWTYDDGNGNTSSQTQQVVITGINDTLFTDTVIPSQQYILTAAHSGAGVAYQWVDCDNNYQPIIGETLQSFVPASSGKYGVVIAQAGCTDTSACVDVLIQNIGLQSFKDQFGLTVYPNPASEILTVKGAALHPGSVVMMTDLTGKRVPVEFLRTDGVITIDVSRLNPGIYLLTVLKGREPIRRMVVKQ